MQDFSFSQYQGSNLHHFLSIEDHSRDMLLKIMAVANSFYRKDNRIKNETLLKGKTVANLFFENSTRTKSTFEIAEKKLGCHVLNIDIDHSATKKGETLLDTILNLQAMQVDAFVIRHYLSGAPLFIAKNLYKPTTIINAGDGPHAHPTQAMLDILTISQYKKNFASLKITIVGDILHSRVARSLIYALNVMQVSEIRVVAPLSLMPSDFSVLGVHYYPDIDAALEDVDVIVMLRLQKERMNRGFIPSGEEFCLQYGLNKKRLKLAKKDVIVMHPGPTNRGVEIAPQIADSSRSVILNQVTNGIVIRMAVLALTLAGENYE
jgi:aspartate carbamoyltransferase catalytic subunit